MRSSIFILIILLNILTTATSQENKNYLDRHKSYKLEQEFFENSLYGATRYAYGKYIQAKNPAINDDFSNFKDDAAAMAAIAGLRADYMSGENELLSFINKKYPDPVTTPAIMELGNYYYNKKWYGKCIEIYEMIDPDDLTEYDMSEEPLKFKIYSTIQPIIITDCANILPKTTKRQSPPSKKSKPIVFINLLFLITLLKFILRKVNMMMSSSMEKLH